MPSAEGQVDTHLVQMEKDASLARAEEELEAVRREAEALRAALAAEQTSHAAAMAAIDEAHQTESTLKDTLSRTQEKFFDLEKKNAEISEKFTVYESAYRDVQAYYVRRKQAHLMATENMILQQCFMDWRDEVMKSAEL